MTPRQAAPVLTPLRLDVLRMAANGLSDPQIARRTARKLSTVKTTMRCIRRQLGAADRAHAVAIALRCGLLTPADITVPDTAGRRA